MPWNAFTLSAVLGLALASIVLAGEPEAAPMPTATPEANAPTTSEIQQLVKRVLEVHAEQSDATDELRDAVRDVGEGVSSR